MKRLFHILLFRYFSESHHDYGHIKMSKSADAGHFFQTTDALATSERKAAKAKNKHGDPIKLSSKLLAVHVDHGDNEAVYVAEAAGDVKKITLDVR